MSEKYFDKIRGEVATITNNIYYDNQDELHKRRNPLRAKNE